MVRLDDALLKADLAASKPRSKPPRPASRKRMPATSEPRNSVTKASAPRRSTMTSDSTATAWNIGFPPLRAQVAAERGGTRQEDPLRSIRWPSATPRGGKGRLEGRGRIGRRVRARWTLRCHRSDSRAAPPLSLFRNDHPRSRSWGRGWKACWSRASPRGDPALAHLPSQDPFRRNRLVAGRDVGSGRDPWSPRPPIVSSFPGMRSLLDGGDSVVFTCGGRESDPPCSRIRRVPRGPLGGPPLGFLETQYESCGQGTGAAQGWPGRPSLERIKERDPIFGRLHPWT